MAVTIISVEGNEVKICTCTRCQHQWKPDGKYSERGTDPVRCPGCGSPYWNVEKSKGVV